MLDVGDTHRLRWVSRDAGGNPVQPATVTLTITLPDGTTDTPSVAPAADGIHTYDYVVTQYGRHVVRWVATDPDDAFMDVFSAADPDWPVLVGLDEVRRHLRYRDDDHSDDEELRAFIASASAVVEDITGTVGRRTVVETNSGGDWYIVLSRSPVVEVTKVVVDGQEIDLGDCTWSPSGLLARRSGRWPGGLHNVEVTYVAGRKAVPPNVHNGVLELIRINWRPQQGGNYSPFDGGNTDDFGNAGLEASLQGNLRLGFFIPNTVIQRLQPSSRPPVVL